MVLDVGDGGLHGVQVALQRKDRCIVDRCLGIGSECVNPLGQRLELGRNLLVEGGESFGRSVHGKRLARQQLVDLGGKNGLDVGIRILSLRSELNGEITHLVGEAGDFGCTAVAEQAHIVDCVLQRRVNALEVWVGLEHLVGMSLNGIKTLVNFR